jgi:hypothetical protein
VRIHKGAGDDSGTRARLDTHVQGGRRRIYDDRSKRYLVSGGDLNDDRDSHVILRALSHSTPKDARARACRRIATFAQTDGASRKVHGRRRQDSRDSGRTGVRQYLEEIFTADVFTVLLIRSVGVLHYNHCLITVPLNERHVAAV